MIFHPNARNTREAFTFHRRMACLLALCDVLKKYSKFLGLK